MPEPVPYRDIYMFHAKEKGLLGNRNFTLKLPPILTLSEANIDKLDDWMNRYEFEYVREVKRRIKDE